MTCIITQPTLGGTSRIECDEHQDVPDETFADLQDAIAAYEKHWADVKAQQADEVAR